MKINIKSKNVCVRIDFILFRILQSELYLAFGDAMLRGFEKIELEKQ